MRGLHPDYDTALNNIFLKILITLQIHLRHRSRKKHGGPSARGSWPTPPNPTHFAAKLTLVHPDGETRHHLYRHLLANGWESCTDPDFDLQSGPLKLLAATEQTGKKTARTFIGLNQQAPDLLPLLAKAGFTKAP